MDFFPQQMLVYQTTMDREKVLESLSQYIDRDVYGFGFSLQDPKHPYIGSITSEGFDLRRNYRGQNSFSLKIRGRFEEMNGGTKVIVDLKLYTAVRVFLYFWTGALSLVLFFILYISITENFGKIVFALIPLFMIGFAYVITKKAFTRAVDDIESDFGCYLDAMPVRMKNDAAMKKML